MEAEGLLGRLDAATVTDPSGVDLGSGDAAWILVIFWSEVAHTSSRLTALLESLVSSSTRRLGASCKPARPGHQEGSGVRRSEPPQPGCLLCHAVCLVLQSAEAWWGGDSPGTADQAEHGLFFPAVALLLRKHGRWWSPELQNHSLTVEVFN